jgi:hypothetical protein
MGRVERWLSERPRRAPAEYATLFARDRIWRDEGRRFVATNPDLEEAADLLQLEAPFAHALAVVLSRLPAATRLPFAERFYASRRPAPGERAELRVAAAAALRVLDLAGRDDLRSLRVVDLLYAAEQGDDLSLTPDVALAEIRKAVARVRLDLDLEDESAPESAAAIAVVEVLDPSSGVVPLQEVLVRAAWAAVESWDPERVLAFLVELDATA